MSLQHIADTCAAGAVCFLGVSLTTIDTIVQIVAGTVTALAAGVSLLLHARSWLERRRGGK